MRQEKVNVNNEIHPLVPRGVDCSSDCNYKRVMIQVVQDHIG